MTVHGYVRVSTADQVDIGTSLPAQQRAITGYAMMRDLTIDHMHIETAVSGSIPIADRPAGKTMMSMLRAGDVVIVPKLDRAFRSAMDALSTLEVFKSKSIGLHMLDLGGDVLSDGMSKMLFIIIAAFSEAERDRIKERIRDVKADMKLRGLYRGGSRQFGYNIDDAGQLVPNLAEQEQLTEMRRLHFDEGVPVNQIGKLFGMRRSTLSRILGRAA